VNFTQQRLQRLQTLRSQRPQFGEIFSFYTCLYEFLDTQHDVFLTVHPQAANQEMKHKEGFPLLTSADLRVDKEKADDFLRRLTEVLEIHGHQGKEELAQLRMVIEEGRLETEDLFRVCLDRDRRAFEERANVVEIPPALLEYVLDTALSYALLRAREEGLEVPTDNWNHGYCPCCGGLPAMGEIFNQDGMRRLHCATCSTSWSFPRLRCAYCGNSDAETLEYFTAEGEESHRVDVCRKCSCYLKVIDNRTEVSDIPMDIEDVSTLHLDLLAQKEGFTRGKKEQP
jgi:FdhE protein